MNLKKGDRVITSSGFYGTIISVEDDTVILKLGENVKVRIAKAAISSLQPGSEKEEI